MKRKPWTNQETSILRKHYGVCRHRTDLMKMLPGRSYDAISCKAYNMDLRGNPYNSNRQYDVDFSAFRTVDRNSSYWAGFIAGDGHITKRGSLIVGLSDKDASHLYKLKDYTGYTGSIATEDRITNFGAFPRRVLRISCVSLCDNLVSVFGIPSGDKSQILRLPDIDDDLVIDFVAGYFDADGCLYMSKKNHPTIAFYGYNPLLSEIKAFLENRFDIETSQPYSNSKTSACLMYRIHCAKAIKVLMAFDNENSLVRKRLQKSATQGRVGGL